MELLIQPKGMGELLRIPTQNVSRSTSRAAAVLDLGQQLMSRVGRPFKKGQSGNPAGKPKGARNATTRAMELLLDEEAEEVTRRAIEMAKSGDGVALRLVMDRILPARKDRHVPFALPVLETPADAVKAMAALVNAVAAGELTPSEAAELSKLVEGFSLPGCARGVKTTPTV